MTKNNNNNHLYWKWEVNSENTDNTDYIPPTPIPWWYKGYDLEKETPFDKFKHPLITLLDFINEKILIRLCDWTADKITELELKLYAKQKRKVENEKRGRYRLD